MRTSITKAERARRVECALELIRMGGGPDSYDHAAVDAELIERFAIADRRSARTIRAQALRQLRGEQSEPRPGPRPRQMTLRAGDAVEIVTTGEMGEAIDATRYTVDVDGDAVRLTNEERDTLTLRKISE